MLATAMLLALAVQAAAFHYEPAGRFAERGACHSAARQNGVLALGCRSGIWLGPADGLVLWLRCRAGGDTANHVRALANGDFAAATPCGLYLLHPDRPPRRLPLPGVPGALASRGDDLLVAVADGLWRIAPRSGQRRRLRQWPGEQPPRSLAWSAHGAVSQGRRCWWLGRWSQRLRAPVRGARGVLWDAERLLWVGPAGALWLQHREDRARPAGRLPLQPGQRVVQVRDLGPGRVWVASRLQGFVMEDRGSRSGWLPAGRGYMLAVREPGGSGPPWLVGRGRLLRPQPGPAPWSGWCRDWPARSWPAAAGPATKERPAPGWLRLLPRVRLAAMGGPGWRMGYREGGGWAWRRGRGWKVGLWLSWPLGEGSWVALDAGVRALQRERMALDLERRERIAALLAERRRLCRQPPDGTARLARAALEAQLAALGWGPLPAPPARGTTGSQR